MPRVGPWRGAVAGAWAGGALGAVEAADRTIALAGFLAGGGEAAGLALLVAAPVVLLATVTGFLLGVAAWIGSVLLSRLPVGRAARIALAGAVVGIAACLWLLFGLTLTARLGRWLGLAPALLGAAAVCGAGLALLAARLRWRPPRAASLSGLALVSLATYFVNSRFAPQSSYGIHVLFDTLQLATAWLAALLVLDALDAGARRLRPKSAGLLLAGGLIAIALGMDHGWRAHPRLEALVKIHGVTARRAMDALSQLLDWDGDGFSPAFLAGGFDTAPLDPAVPEPLLDCSRPMFVPPRAAALRQAIARRPASPAARAAPGARDRPHLLLVTVDACRHDALPGAAARSLLGALAPPLPNFDRLAERSAVFSSCYAHAAGTEDSFGSLFAGRYHPALLCGRPWGEFLPARLAAAGYRTRAWANDFPMPRRDWGWEEIDVREGATEQQIDDLLGFLSEPHAGPAFAWLHFMDLHASILRPWSPQAYDRGAQLARYARGLAAVDRALGRLTRALEERSLQERTLLVLTADHGEELGEHGHYHHNLTLYEPATRVPLWIAGPRVVPGPRAGLVPQLDLHATLLEVAGLPAEGSGGRSLLSALATAGDRVPPQEIYLFLPTRGFSRGAVTVRVEQGQAAWVDPTGTRKAIVRFDKETEEFYDLASDPGERRSLAGGGAPWTDEARAAVWREVRRWSMPRRRRARRANRPSRVGKPLISSRASPHAVRREPPRFAAARRGWARARPPACRPRPPSPRAPAGRWRS